MLCYVVSSSLLSCNLISSYLAEQAEPILLNPATSRAEQNHSCLILLQAHSSRIIKNHDHRPQRVAYRVIEWGLLAVPDPLPPPYQGPLTTPVLCVYALKPQRHLYR